MKTWCLAAFAVATLGILAGCHLTPKSAAVHLDELQLYVETTERTGREWQLPQSGVTVTTDPQPIVDARSITEVRVVPLDLGPALVLSLSPASAATLTKRVGRDPKRLVLVSHDRALGIAHVNRDTQFSHLSMFVEMAVTDLSRWADSIQSRLRDPDRSARE